MIGKAASRRARSDYRSERIAEHLRAIRIEALHGSGKEVLTG